MDLINNINAVNKDQTIIMEMLAMALAWVVFGYRKEKKILVVALELLGVYFTIYIIRCILTNYINLTETGSKMLIWVILHGIVGAVYVVLCTRLSRRTKVLLWVAVYTSILNVTSIGGRLGVLLKTQETIQQAGLIRIASYFLILPIVMLIRYFDFDSYMKVPNSGIIMLGFCGIGSFSFNICESVFGFSEEMELISKILLLAYVILLLMELIGIFTLHTMCAEQMNLMQLQIQQVRLQSEREMTQISAETLENLRFIRHDLKNQYAYMDILLEQKRYDELRDYFAGQIDRIEVLNLIDCGNHALNTVLNMYHSRLKKDGIVTEHQIIIPPVLPFSDEDVCSLLTNLLDNAQEECKRLKKEGQKDVTIRLEIHPHSSYLLIRCENTTDRTTLTYNEKGLVTTKKDSNMHGYGTKIISKIAEKYNGQVKFYLEDQKFIAIAMLDMMMEEYANGN